VIKRLGRWSWRSEDRLGRGGYAEVFAGAGEGRAGAIKVFRDAAYANTFEREVAALEALRGCPHTPALLDCGRDAAGRLCIVTAKVPGVALDVHLRRHGPLGLARTAALIGQLLDVLAWAHARGWLHKDLKASNVLVAGDEFSLLDWGIAEPVGDGRAEAIRSKNQDAVAPECYYGRHGPASDFYQLGLLAWHALSASMQYRLDTQRERDYRVAAHCLERPQLDPAVGGDLLPLVANWLDKNPERRLVGYDLNALRAEAPRHAPDFSAALDYGQLGSEGFLLRAARAGVPYAMHTWGERLIAQDQAGDALYWLEQAAAKGYARSAYRLARLPGTAAARSEGLLRTAATAGMSSAQYRLAEHLRKNGATAEAMVWLRRAAEQGERSAQYRLARILEKQGASPTEVAEWYGRAADRGHEAAAQRGMMAQGGA